MSKFSLKSYCIYLGAFILSIMVRVMLVGLTLLKRCFLLCFLLFISGLVLNFHAPLNPWSKLIVSNAYAQAQLPTFSKFSHYANREDLASVLADFAKTQRLIPSFSSLIKGTISGTFNQVDGALFLEAMRAAYGVNYYIANDVIYFYHETEITKSAFKPTSMTAQGLLEALNRTAFTSPQLPIQLDTNGLLVVSGPVSYVNSILSAATSLDQANNVAPVMKVFPLKYARADDITINSMDQTMVVPGVASILQRMVSGQSTGNSGISITKQQPIEQGLLGTGLSSSRYGDKGNDGGKNSSGGSIAESLTSIALGGGDSKEKSSPINVIADGRLNAVIVQDLPSRMAYYAQVIKELDRPTKLVELHAAIIDVDVDASDSLGINWNGSVKSGDFTFGGGVGQLVTSDNILNPSGGGVFSTIFDSKNSSFMAQLKLLEKDKKAKTLGRPSVITMDNVEATLEDTRTLYVPVSGYQATDLFKVDSGTVLRVTPHIITEPDGSRYIQMAIELKSNQDNSNSNISTQIGEDGRVVVIPPAVAQTKINTQALVKEGQSLLIGGYYVENTQADDSGVPGLKDVKGLGTLFGSEDNSSYQRKRLLLITPRILDLNELNNLPQDIEQEGFIASPTQNHYNYLIKEPEESSGCSSTKNKQQQGQGQLIQGQSPQNHGVSQPSQGQALIPELSSLLHWQIIASSKVALSFKFNSNYVDTGALNAA